jgi:hypothetical protein
MSMKTKEVRDGQKFKLDTKDYKFKATDTQPILVALRDGLLRSCPLE